MAGEVAIGLERIRDARAAVSGQYSHTPALRLTAVDEMLDGRIALKAENLQASGSFKLRGAATKLHALGEDCADGVVAGTAGNHGRALAYAAQRRGVRCELFVPADAPISKTEPAARLGAELQRCEGGVDACVALAEERAESTGLAFVHPFDDPDIVAGQGSCGLELLEDVPDLARVVVPVGGGGLAAGIAIAIRSQRPEIEVIGVQADACPSFPESIAEGHPVTVEPRSTVADGIAVKRPGELTMPLIEEWVASLAVVGEDEVGDAMAALLAEAKLVVEGAGAVGVAALASGRVEPAAEGTTAVVLSGGNIDETMLAAISRRAGARHGRGAVLFTKISDRPHPGPRTHRFRGRRARRAWLRRHSPARGGEAATRRTTARGEPMSEQRRTIDAEGAPEAIGPYSHAVASNGLLFCSGQVPLDPATGELVGGDVVEQAIRCLRNLEAVCDEAETSLRRAVRLTIYTKQLDRFDAINEAYGEFFDDEPPARAAVGVDALPKGALIEIDAVVAL